MASSINALLPGTELVNVVEQTWRPRFSLEANDELVIARNFDDAGGVTKIGATLNISKIAVKSSVNLGTTSEAAAGDLTWEQDVEANVTVSARDDYAAVAVPRNSINRILRSADLMAGLKKQLQSALMTGIDVQAGSLVPSLSTNIVGSGAVGLSKTLITSAMGKLAASAKEFYKIGRDEAYLCVYVLQTDDLMNITEFTSADVRGDTANPNVTGRVWSALGLQVNESGNISTSGGAAHNLLHIRQSHVLAYNEEPMLLTPQENGLATLLIAYTSYGVGEIWDEYAVDLQTTTT